MLKSLTKLALGVVSLTTLMNCSGLEQIEEIQDFANVAIDASRSRSRVLGDPILGTDPLPGTQFDAVPTAGEATFKGSAYVAATSAADPSVGFALVGRSEVTVDFGPGTDNLTGMMFDFQAASLNEGIVDVSGTLGLHDGVIGEDSPNSFTVGYSGDLTVDGDPFSLSGDMLGRLQGTRTEPAAGQSVVRALSALDENGRVEAENQVLTGRVLLVVEN